MKTVKVTVTVTHEIECEVPPQVKSLRVVESVVQDTVIKKSNNGDFGPPGTYPNVKVEIHNIEEFQND